MRTRGPLTASIVALTIFPWQDTRAQSLDEVLQELDHRALAVTDLSGDFTEEKFSSLLKKPLVSKGRLFIKGERTRWHTQSPHDSTLYTDASRVAVFFPSRATMEVYPIDQRLRALVVSPIPRVHTLQSRFDIEIIEPRREMDQPGDGALIRRLRLTPKDNGHAASRSLAEFIRSCIVTIDRKLGLATRVELLDPEGDRTILTFTNLRVNTGKPACWGLTDKDVEWNVPPDTKIIYPLGSVINNGSTQSLVDQPTIVDQPADKP